MILRKEKDGCQLNVKKITATCPIVRSYNIIIVYYVPTHTDCVQYEFNKSKIC